LTLPTCIARKPRDGGDGDTQAMGRHLVLGAKQVWEGIPGSEDAELKRARRFFETLDGKRPKLSSLAAALLERLITFSQSGIGGATKMTLVFCDGRSVE